jgi:predicted small secreted protein
MMKNVRLGMLAMLGVVGLGLSACNTLEGAGRDIENTGEAVQDAAD